MILLRSVSSGFSELGVTSNFHLSPGRITSGCWLNVVPLQSPKALVTVMTAPAAGIEATSLNLKAAPSTQI